MAARAPTLKAIAEATGYSLMTVSRAMRGMTNVNPQTAQKIQRAARKLGYEYNPEVTRVMSLMRGGKRDQYRENLAMLVFNDPDTLRKNPYLHRTMIGARERAKQLGYKLEPFYFDAYEFRARRVCQVLSSRGIRGIVLFPVLSNKAFILERLRLDWEHFAWVAFGNSHDYHEFNRVGHHHFFGMEQLLQQLKKRGYRRPFLLLSSQIDATVHRAYQASFLVHHPEGPETAADCIDVRDSESAKVIDLIRKTRADVVISNQQTAYWKALRTQGRRALPELGLASLHCNPDGEQSGIDQQNDILGQYAVDMLVAQITRGERGLPREPKLMLNKGRWHEGSTLRPISG